MTAGTVSTLDCHGIQIEKRSSFYCIWNESLLVFRQLLSIPNATVGYHTQLCSNCKHSVMSRSKVSIEYKKLLERGTKFERDCVEIVAAVDLVKVPRAQHSPHCLSNLAQKHKIKHSVSGPMRCAQATFH